MSLQDKDSVKQVFDLILDTKEPDTAFSRPNWVADKSPQQPIPDRELDIGSDKLFVNSDTVLPVIKSPNTVAVEDPEETPLLGYHPFLHKVQTSATVLPRKKKKPNCKKGKNCKKPGGSKKTTKRPNRRTTTRRPTKRTTTRRPTRRTTTRRTPTRPNKPKSTTQKSTTVTAFGPVITIIEPVTQPGQESTTASPIATSSSLPVSSTVSANATTGATPEQFPPAVNFPVIVIKKQATTTTTQATTAATTTTTTSPSTVYGWVNNAMSVVASGIVYTLTALMPIWIPFIFGRRRKRAASVEDTDFGLNYIENSEKIIENLQYLCETISSSEYLDDNSLTVRQTCLRFVSQMNSTQENGNLFDFLSLLFRLLIDLGVYLS